MFTKSKQIMLQVVVTKKAMNVKKKLEQKHSANA